MLRIGVLSLQGSSVEHVKMLSRLEDVVPCEVKCREDLEQISGIILPGGESTTIGKLMKEFGITSRLKERIRGGMPVWGTCAGMILLAGEIIDEGYTHLGMMDISVKRNAYGGQLDSFVETCLVPEVSEKTVPLVFIRAPRVEKTGESVRVLTAVNGNAAAVRQGNMLATSFHPELTDDLSFHRYFAEMARIYEKVE